MTEITRSRQTNRMSKIVKHQGIVYLSGLVGPAEGSLEDQTQDVLNQIDDLLNEAGSSRKNMLRVEIWLSDMADFAAMNAVYDAWVPQGNQPTRACGESRLARAALKVEMIVTAAYG